MSLSPVLSGPGAVGHIKMIKAKLASTTHLVVGFLLSSLQNWGNAPCISRASGGSPGLSVENGLESPGRDVRLPDGGLVL